MRTILLDNVTHVEFNFYDWQFERRAKCGIVQLVWLL
jgi:uncharacterized integral membrane protein